MKIADVLKKDDGAKIDRIEATIKKIFYGPKEGQYGWSTGCEIADDTASISVFLNGERKVGERVTIQHCNVEDRDDRQGKKRRGLKTSKDSTIDIDGGGWEGKGQEAPKESQPAERHTEYDVPRGPFDFAAHALAVAKIAKNVAHEMGVTLDGASNVYPTLMIQAAQLGLRLGQTVAPAQSELSAKKTDGMSDAALIGLVAAKLEKLGGGRAGAIAIMKALSGSETMKGMTRAQLEAVHVKADALKPDDVTDILSPAAGGGVDDGSDIPFMPTF